VTFEDKDKAPYEEFHRILSHRFVKNKIQYSVAWKQKPGKKRVQVSWVYPEDFVNKKFINDYHNHLNQIKSNARMTRSKGRLMGNINSLYFSIIMFIFFSINRSKCSFKHYTFENNRSNNLKHLITMINSLIHRLIVKK
jgi:hypothetical protein